MTPGSLQSIAKPEIQVIGRPHVLNGEVYQTQVPFGSSIAEIVGPVDRNFIEVEIEGEQVPYRMWRYVRPKLGTLVIIRAYPQGISQEQAKTIGTVITLVALVAATILTAGLTAPLLGAFTVGQAAALGVGLLAFGAKLFVNSLVKPNNPIEVRASDPMDRVHSVTGTSNNANPYGVVPIVIGDHRFFPPLAGQAFTEQVGDDQYIRYLLDLGYGDFDISDINIGDNDILDYGNVEYEIGVDPALYSDDVQELTVGSELDLDGGPAVERTSSTVLASGGELQVELQFPTGLYTVDVENQLFDYTAMFFIIQYRPVGGSWANVTTPPAPGLQFSNPMMGIDTGTVAVESHESRNPLTVNIRWQVPAGTYEVSVQRQSSFFPSDPPDEQKSGLCVYRTLRTVKYTNPSTIPTTKMALRIRATGQLNGNINQVNMRLKQYIPVWNGVTFSDELSTNPAWIFYWLMTACPANPRLVSADRMDFQAIVDWAAECDDKEYVYGAVIDAQTTLWQILADVCAAGRATLTVKDGLYSVVRDTVQTTPVQHFTPRNSWGFSGSRSFTDQIHALRCQFINPAADWQQDEMIVYDDGYNVGNATKFETMTFRGVLHSDAVWRLARYHMAVGRLRQNEYHWNTDIEHMVCNRGDLVKVSHDVPRWGLGWGRVAEFQPESGDVEAIRLDENLEMLSRNAHTVRVRTEAGTSLQSIAKSRNLTVRSSSSFSRASAASYMNNASVIAEASDNVARYEYGQRGFLGLLIEPSRTNLVIRSRELSNETSAWSRVGLQPTLPDVSGPLSPDGTYNADGLVEDGSAGQHYLKQNVTLTDSQDYTWSCYVSPDTRTFVRLFAVDKANATHQVWFNLTTGVVGTNAGGLTAWINEQPNGWFRVAMKFNAGTGGTTPFVAVALADADGSSSYTGDNNVGILHAWGAQCEIGGVPTNPIHTGATTNLRMPETDFTVAVSDIPDFSGTEGSFVVEWENPFTLVDGSRIFQVDDGTEDHRMGIKRSGANLVLDVKEGGSTGSITIGAVPTQGPGNKIRVAFRYKSGEWAASVNGSEAVEGAMAFVPTGLTTVRLGWDVTNGQKFSGNIRRLVHWNEHATLVQLEGLSETTAAIPNEYLWDLVTPMANVGVGDLTMMGLQAQEAVDLIITKIQPNPDMSAAITAVDYAPAVFTADAGTPPAFVSPISGRVYAEPPPIPAITVLFTSLPEPGDQGQTDPEIGGVYDPFASQGYW